MLIKRSLAPFSLLTCFSVFVLSVQFVEAATPQIEGAAGRVEYWYPLNALPRSPVTFIVTHDSWGSFGSGRNTARSQSGGPIGAEWWVLAEGTILHSDSERRTGHCGQYRAPGVSGDCNGRSVGIEFEGFGQLTEAQVRSGLALIKFLQERYCIQSTNVAAHRKAQNEGVPMMQAAQKMAYKPACNGARPSGEIPDDIVSQAFRNSQSQPASLQDVYNRYNVSSPPPPPQYQPQTLPTSQYILNPQQGVVSPTGQTNPGASTPTLRPISLSEGEADPTTISESRGIQPISSSTKIIIVYPTTTSSLEVPFQETLDALPLQPASIVVTPFVAETTFAPSSPGEPVTVRSGTSYIAVLLDGMKSILLRMLTILRLS